MHALIKFPNDRIRVDAPAGSSFNTFIDAIREIVKLYKEENIDLEDYIDIDLTGGTDLPEFSPGNPYTSLRYKP